MANIGQFEVGTEWKKLDEVTDYTFEADKGYTIQNKGHDSLLLCEDANAPTENEVGFILQTGQAFGYTCKSGEYCWVKAFSRKAQFNISEGI